MHSPLTADYQRAKGLWHLRQRRLPDVLWPHKGPPLLPLSPVLSKVWLLKCETQLWVCRILFLEMMGFQVHSFIFNCVEVENQQWKINFSVPDHTRFDPAWEEARSSHRPGSWTEHLPRGRGDRVLYLWTLLHECPCMHIQNLWHKFFLKHIDKLLIKKVKKHTPENFSQKNVYLTHSLRCFCPALCFCTLTLSKVL